MSTHTHTHVYVCVLIDTRFVMQHHVESSTQHNHHHSLKGNSYPEHTTYYYYLLSYDIKWIHLIIFTRNSLDAHYRTDVSVKKAVKF